MLDMSTMNRLTAAQSKLQLSNDRFKAYERKQKRLEEKASQRQGILDRLREQQRQSARENRIAELDCRLKNGGALTPDEVAYLQKESPGLYEQRMNERQELEAYENDLSNAKTKDDVESLHMTRLMQYLSEARAVSNASAIPDGKKVEIMTQLDDRLERMEKATIKFKTSAKYESLPGTESEKTDWEQAGRAEKPESSDDEKSDDASFEKRANASGDTAAADKDLTADAPRPKSGKEEKKKAEERSKAFIPENTHSAEAVTIQLLSIIHSHTVPKTKGSPISEIDVLI